MGTPAAVQGRQSNNRHPGPATVGSLSGWIALGFLGAVGMVVTGTRVGSVPRPGDVRWWFSIPSGGSPYVVTVFYLATGLLIAAWLGLGRHAWRRRLTPGHAWIVLAVWGLPFFLGPPLFSRDMYSYIAQGLIAHHGLDPYQVGPSSLGPGPVLASVAQVWRSTTSPYGPLFIESSRLLAAGTAGSLIGAVMAFRAFELVGVVLIMFFLPRLARHLGTDPGIALWLGVLSPLALFSFIASGHNDALLVGLLVAGVSLAVEGRLAWGFVLCAAAVTVKLPALAAIVFLAVDGFCSRASGRRWRVVIEAVAITAVVFVSATLLAGYGWAWLGPSALHVPTKLRLLSTPSVSLGVLVFHILHPLGVGSARSSIVTATEYVVATGAVLGTVWLLATVRRHEIVRSLGLALLLIVVGSPTLWPWYLMWGLVLLAATTAQRSRALAAVAALAMLVVGPSGSPRLLGWSYVIVSLAVVAACVWLVRHRRWHRVVVGNGA